jgi:hypothetical protein
MKKWSLLISLLWLECSNHPPAANIKVVLTDNNSSVQISGFDKEIIDEIGRDTNNEAWQALLPVYKMPVDTDMKDFQNAQPGKYQVKDSLVIFTPDTAFKKGQTYFLRSYQYGEIKDAWQYIRQKSRTNSLNYKDLPFSY